MSFGDQRYRRTEPVRSSSAHPWARATGDALAGGLRSTYSYGQQAGRFLGSASEPLTSGRRAVIEPGAGVPIAIYSGRVWLPDYVTHVRASFAYGIPSDLSLPLDVYLGVGSDTLTETIDVNGADGAATDWMQDYLSVLSHALEVEVTPSGGGYADVFVTLGSSKSVQMARVSCVVTGEVRP